MSSCLDLSDVSSRTNCGSTFLARIPERSTCQKILLLVMSILISCQVFHCKVVFPIVVNKYFVGDTSPFMKTGKIIYP